MLFLLFFAAFIAFPESNDAIFANENKNNIEIETVGSLGVYDYPIKKCVKTYGNETISEGRKSDWCSIITNNDVDPYIQYSIKNKKMKVKKYAVRNGCCDFSCCKEENGKIINKYCCCDLYSYSLVASNDKRKWIPLHRMEKDNNFYNCKSKVFEIENNEIPYKYFRFVLNENYPNCERCLQINQIEFYGETILVNDDSNYDQQNDDDDESISIIGRVRRNE